MEAHDDNSIEPTHPHTVLGNVAAFGLVSEGLRRGGRRVFTPAAINIIRELATQGKSASEIAKVIGSTPASVRVKCCHLKIELRRRKRPTRQIGWRSVVSYLHAADYAALKRKAAELEKSAGELAGELLKAIICSEIYEAVLDDDKYSGRKL
jgi:hypothetical protein